MIKKGCMVQCFGNRGITNLFPTMFATKVLDGPFNLYLEGYDNSFITVTDINGNEQTLKTHRFRKVGE